MTTRDRVRFELEKALALIDEREAVRPREIWRHSGARGMAVHVMAKAERMFVAVLEGDPRWSEIVLAEAPDVINYSALLAQQARADDLNGDWPWPEEMKDAKCDAQSSGSEEVGRPAGNLPQQSGPGAD